jgi:hypothetical protein
LNSPDSPSGPTFSARELEEVLRAAANRAILVGGQALAVWANYYQVAVPEELTAAVTRDADFIGNSDTALQIRSALSDKNWKYEEIKPGALTPVVAQLTLEVDGGIKEIDFLRSILGLRTEDVRRRAVRIELASGCSVTVLHPLDVLASRLHNLAELPEKRDAKGISQARLAIAMTERFLRAMANSREERELFNLIERLRMIVVADPVASVCRQFQLDVLPCVPLDAIRNDQFKARRWPQIQQEVHAKIASALPL